MKKRVALILAVLLLTMPFIGYGQAASEEPVVIEWLAQDGQATPDPESDIFKAVEERFNAKIDVWAIDMKTWDETLNVRLATGDMPDVMRINNRANIGKYVDMGILAEIPLEMIKEKAPSYWAMVEKYDVDHHVWPATTYNGKNYGFSGIRLDGTYPSIPIWRQDWLENVGISSVPTTLAEFEEAIYKFRNDDPDKNGEKDTYGLSKNAFAMVFGAFGIYFDGTAGEGLNRPMLKDGKVVMTPIQPEAKEALAYLAKWYQDGVIDPEFVTGENKGGYWATSDALVNSRIGVTVGPSHYHYNPPYGEGDLGGTCYQNFMEINPNGKIIEGTDIAGPGAVHFMPKQGYLAHSFGITTKAMADERKVDTIFAMLEEIYANDEYCVMVEWGTEGKQYFRDPVTNDIKTTPGYDNVVARQEGLMVFNFVNSDPDVWKANLSQRFEYADRVSKNMTSVPPPLVPATEEATQYSAALTKLTAEAIAQIITGEKPIEYFDEFVEIYRANGGDALETAMTNAYLSTQLN